MASSSSRSGPQALEADLDHRQLEPLAVFGRGDCFGIGADQFDTMFFEHASFEGLHRQVQGRLATQRGQQSIGLLDLDDFGKHLERQRLDVGRVGELGVGHDRCRVRVRQDDPVALVAQHTACLSARLVELTGLTNHDWARADEQNA